MIPEPVIPIPLGLILILITIPGFSKIHDSDSNKPGFDSDSDSGDLIPIPESYTTLIFS